MNQQFPVGSRVKVTQLLKVEDKAIEFSVEGKLLRRERIPIVESSFSGSDDDVFWIEEITLEKDDGERSGLTVEQNTKVELVLRSAK